MTIARRQKECSKIYNMQRSLRCINLIKYLYKILHKNSRGFVLVKFNFPGYYLRLANAIFLALKFKLSDRSG